MNRTLFFTRYLPAFLLLLALFLVPSGMAHAYIDPGTGSFILQMLLAGFFAFLFMLKRFRQKVLAWITALWRKKDDA